MALPAWLMADDGASSCVGPASHPSPGGRLFAALARGQLTSLIGERLPLAQAADAHRRLKGRQTIGAVLLLPRLA